MAKTHVDLKSKACRFGKGLVRGSGFREQTPFVHDTPPNTEHSGHKNEAMACHLYALASFFRKTVISSALFLTFLRSFCPLPPHKVHSESQKTPIIGLFDSKNHSKQIFISFLPRNSCRTRQRIHTFATKTEQKLREIALHRVLITALRPFSRKSSIQSYNS